jgi:hypothetical protein
MLNPFAPPSDPGSYVDLRKRMHQNVQYLRVNDKIFEVVKNAYEHALIRENVVLSRPERNRMLSQIMKMSGMTCAGNLTKAPRLPKPFIFLR